MTTRCRDARLVAVLAAALLLGACAPGRAIVRGNWPDGRIEVPVRARYVTPVAPIPEAAPVEEFVAASPPPAMTAADLNRLGVLSTIHFEFDRSDVRAVDTAIMEQNAIWLREHPGARIIVEGHTDDRGTRVYNLALGQRRADAARDFLVSLGVDPARMETVSFGEELPAMEGQNEVAWAANRRAVFVIVATGEYE